MRRVAARPSSTVVCGPSFLATVPLSSPAPAAAGLLGSGVPVLTCENACHHQQWRDVPFGREARWRDALPPLRPPYREAEANRNNLLGIEQLRRIWLFTHGFFCTDPQMPEGNTGPDQSTWQDPMERSALVLAGADASEPEVRRNSYVPSPKDGAENEEAE